MPAQLWYLRVNGQPAGPFEPQDLRRLAADGRLSPNDRLRRSGDVKWHRATKIVGLFDENTNDRADPSRPNRANAEPAGLLHREFDDVSSILQRGDFDQRRFRRTTLAQLPTIQLSGSAAETIRPRPIFTAPVIGVAALTALMIYLAVAALAAEPAHLDETPRFALHEPTVARAVAAASEAILGRTDPKTAEISGLELLRQTEQASETSPAWFTFRGEVRWTNRLGTPVEADFGVIVRYDPRISAYAADLVTLGDRVVLGQVEVCGHTRPADFNQLSQELFQR